MKIRMPWWLTEALGLVATGALRMLAFGLPALLFALFILLMKGGGSWLR